MNGGFDESPARPCATPNVLFRLVFVRKPPFRFRPSPVVRGAHLEGPLVARLRHADCIGRCPLPGVTQKTVLTLSSSQFDPERKSDRLDLCPKLLTLG
jgi:hypothetical protein